MTTATVAAGRWLAADAAASYQRACAAGLPAGITSAGRTRAEQRVLFAQRFTTNYAASAKHDRRWYEGRYWWRRPGWTSAATPGSATSRHELGLSLDLPAGGPREWMHAHGANFGWIGHLVPAEPWHFEYQATRDTHLTTTPPPAPKPATTQEDPMFILRKRSNGACILLAGGRASAIKNTADLGAYQAAGIKTVNLSDAGFTTAYARYSKG